MTVIIYKALVLSATTSRSVHLTAERQSLSRDSPGSARFRNNTSSNPCTTMQAALGGTPGRRLQPDIRQL